MTIITAGKHDYERDCGFMPSKMYIIFCFLTRKKIVVQPSHDVTLRSRIILFFADQMWRAARVTGIRFTRVFLCLRLMVSLRLLGVMMQAIDVAIA